MAYLYSSQEQGDAVAAAAAAPNGTKVATFLGVWQSRLGINPQLRLYRNGVAVWTAQVAGLLPIVNTAFVIPVNASQLALLTADITTGTWQFKIENASNPNIYLGADVTQTGATDILQLTASLSVGGVLTIGSIVFNAPSLDSTTATLASTDPRVVAWTDPNLTWGNQPYPLNGTASLIQCTQATAGKQLQSLGSSVGILGGEGEYALARVVDPDNSAKMSFLHQLGNPANGWPLWFGNTIRSGWNTPSDGWIQDGQVYWIGLKCKFASNFLSGGSWVPFFDIHHRDDLSVFKRAPIQFLRTSPNIIRIDRFGCFNTNITDPNLVTKVEGIYSTTFAANDTFEWVMRFRTGTNWGDQAFMQVWERKNGGTVTKVVDVANVEIGYHDTPRNTEYAKMSLYEFGGFDRKTMHSKGYLLVKEGSGNPILDQNVFFNVLASR